MKLLVDNTASRAFNMYTIPPTEGDPEMAAAIRELSRLKYGRPRNEVEVDIMERSQLGESMKEGSTEPVEASL